MKFAKMAKLLIHHKNIFPVSTMKIYISTVNESKQTYLSRKTRKQDQYKLHIIKWLVFS